MRLGAIGALALCLVQASAADGQAPRRVVSINLCTDQLLLALADPGQITALGRWARHREMSHLAEAAGQHRIIRGTAEEVLRLEPDLVLAGAFSGAATRAVLQGQGLRVETFAAPRTIAEAKSEIARAAGLLGQLQRGALLTADIDAALAAAARSRARPLTALALQRRGYVAGTDTLLSDVIAQVGLANAAAALGARSVERASLELIARTRPDILIVEELGSRTRDQASALLHHPALTRAVPAARTVAVPVAELTCAGPALPALIVRLRSAARDAASRPLP